MKTLTKSSDVYKRLLTHSQKQYGNVSIIHKAYIQAGQVYAIDYTSTKGMEHIATETAIADRVILFK